MPSIGANPGAMKLPSGTADAEHYVKTVKTVTKVLGFATFFWGLDQAQPC